MALRYKGIRTYLITKNRYMGWSSKYFDDLIVVNNFDILKELDFDFLHIQGNNGVYFDYHKLTDKPILYDFYDIYGMCGGGFNNSEENYILDNYYKIIAGYDISSTPEHVRQKTVEFHSYPLRQFFIPNHCGAKYFLIYAGCLCPSGSSSDKEFFSNCRKYHDQGCCVDIYYSPQSKYKVRKYNTDGVKMFRGLELEKATLVFSKYGFGLFVNFESQNYHHRIPSKFWHYLESGLPVIVHENMRYHAKIVEDEGIGIVISDGDNIRAKIDRYDYLELVKNVYEYREKICMDDMIGKLIAVYNELWRD